MLRRYLISNIVSTAAFYAVVVAYVPTTGSLSKALYSSIDAFIMGHTFLGPVLTRMISVAADIGSSLVAIF